MRFTNTAAQQYNEQRFRNQVDQALTRVKKILSTDRNPTYAADTDHTYDDKYALAQSLTNVSIASTVNVLEKVGLDGAKISKLRKLAVEEKVPVNLRFEGRRTCAFVEERKVKVDNASECVYEAVETTKKSGATTKEKTTSVKHKVIREVTEYLWKVDVTYSLFAYGGSDPERDDRVLLQSRSSRKDVVTTGTKKSPFPSTETLGGPFDVPLTWLLENLSASGGKPGDDNICSFVIDRSAESCRTPRRNDDVKGAVEFFTAVQGWSAQVRRTLRQIDNTLNSNQPGQNAPSEEPAARIHLDSITGDDVFVPVLPLFEEPDASRGTAGDLAAAADEGRAETEIDRHGAGSLVVSRPLASSEKGSGSSPLLSTTDIDSFLNEQIRSMDGAIAKLTQSFPPSDGDEVVSSAEGVLYLLSLHTESIASHYFDGVGYIEEMLRKQLIAAIGKTIHESDFAEYVRFHDTKLFRDEYKPEPFCYAIRRPDHFPDGVLSIEQECGSGSGSGDQYEPVTTLTRNLGSGARPTRLPINAATTVELTGNRYLHAWILHRFAGRQVGRFKLIARARQFSSFMLVIGKIAGPDGFEAKDAIIVRNKDELLVPLLLDQLPSPKEFKDAISSLSPEQKRFATAFRDMQLESSVFGVCCIQLKPQLEVLLGLPPDALTKEVRLTQDLLSLFIDYQIPSDLLSFDGSTDMSSAEKVGVVKGHAKNVLEMIESSKERDLKAAEQEADMAFEMSQAERSSAMAMPRGEMFESNVGFGGSPQPQMMAMDLRLRAAPRSSNAMPPPPPAPVYKSAISAPAPEVMDDGCMPPQAAESQRISNVPDSSLEKSTTESEKKGLDYLDFTTIPKQLDAKFDELDEESALRATTIKTADAWTKKSQKNLLAKLEEKGLGTKGRKSEHDKAFDLLDALSRSGSLPIACAELHVIVCATHCFDRSLMDTVIVDNVNPIEKMERSLLIVASTIHGVPAKELLKDDSQVTRVEKYSPMLFPDDL